MVFGGNSSNDVEIRVKVNSEGVISTFDQLGNKLSEIETQSDGAAKGFSNTQAALVTLSSTVQLAKDAFALLQGAASLAIDSISRGSEVDDITVSFQNLAKEAGASGDALLNKLNTALADTIPNFDLMRQANELLVGGLKPDQIELVAKAARTLGEVTGTSAAEGMNQLSDSLLRGNDRALKTLGIVVDNSKALMDFAVANGVAVESLSESAKVLAIREASLKALVEQEERFGEVTVDAGDRIQQVNKVVTDSFDELYKRIAGDAGVNAALDQLVTAVKSIDLTAFAAQIATVITALTKLISYLAQATAAVVAFANKTSAIDRAIGRNLPGFDLFDEKLQSIIGLLSKDSEDATRQAITEFNKLGKTFTTMANNGELLDTTVGALNLEFNKVAEQIHAATGESVKFEDSTVKTNSAAKTLASGGLTDVIKAAQKAEEAGKKLAAEALKEVEKAAADLDKELDELAKNDWATKLLEDIKKAQEGGGLFGGLFDNILGGLDGKNPELIKVGRDLGENITDSLLSGISAAIDGALNGASGEELRASAVSVATDIGASIADAYLPGSGQVVQLFEPILGNIVESIFGGEDAGTTARKAADKFFADAFDANRLQVIIDGQLKEISDLVFKGDSLFGGDVDFTDGTFSNFLASLPGEAQAAFNGVGLAFEELLGIGEDVGGQLAAVFANNVGGSLNNLQLLVQATGKSFEELKGFVVEAFLDGKISALEAQTALNGLAQVAQKGIPDAIGATVQAFDNLKGAGVKGGRALIDALQDIGYEAKELGLKDFPALQAQLAASGKFTQQEIEQLFQALRDNGIDSIEELTSATNEQLLPILSQLQAQEFPFADAANGAAELIETISDLPNEKTLTFNIKTNFDSNTQAAQSQGYVPNMATSISTAGQGKSLQ